MVTQIRPVTELENTGNRYNAPQKKCETLILNFFFIMNGPSTLHQLKIKYVYLSISRRGLGGNNIENLTENVFSALVSLRYL